MKRVRDRLEKWEVILSGLWLGIWKVLKSKAVLEDHSRVERLC